MTAGTRCHSNQPIGAFFDGLLGEAVVDHIMEHDAAVAVDHLIDPFLCSQRGNDNRHLVLHAHVHVVLEARVGAMHYLVDCEGSGGRIRVRFVIGCQFRGDPLQPFFQNGFWACIERRERAYNACFALCYHQIRVGDDEKRGSHDGQS